MIFTQTGGNTVRYIPNNEIEYLTLVKVHDPDTVDHGPVTSDLVSLQQPHTQSHTPSMMTYVGVRGPVRVPL